jgi:hypothetical protein
MGKCECYVTTTDEKQEEWKQIFPDGKLPVRCPFPVGTFEHPMLKEPHQFYELAIERLTSEERKRLVAFISKKFNISEETVNKELDKQGCPIRAENTIAHWCDLHFRCVI